MTFRSHKNERHKAFEIKQMTRSKYSAKDFSLRLFSPESLSGKVDLKGREKKPDDYRLVSLR
uniref:Uncharacterized protein n=1 Tax=Candidatus Kentrum eta TaxID=2126337 RepID=A0A450U9Y5_9GAMM|nr:MAG: hypothetical protein BECKH772A_GA0070896_1001130 [Candidatus Kentron sp. H]VFJ90442.1 MAG: hypothetical protein BECKH772B_GA0070898_1000932 [Candidatus Kentron sp. H]VFJ97080.1 MAG: hypothetical protein BECKH772C_GA0070978_1001030 [Candidatus Kentron sp. H]